ncbi:MAG: hypothetical protein E7647_01535 [Ruminococcaceae bacterium]|nr:hypothetical protein [Oscillospiraceae bacterium]
MKKYYRIAGLCVAMDSFGKTEKQAKDYLITENDPPTPDIQIVSNRQKLMSECPYLGEDSCEYLSTGNSFYRQLIDHNGLLIHSSAVVMDGKAYLFSAPCGTGKSTHTALWQEVFGRERARILNDDKPAVRLENGEFFAYGTPWSGKTDLNINMRVPLAGICMLRRGTENKIKPFGGAMALHAILEQTARSKDADFTVKLLDLLEKLFISVPVWQLECNMEPEAALVSYNAMSKGFENNK